MKKGTKAMLYLLGSAALGGIAYFVTQSLYFLVVIGIIFFLSFIALIDPWLSYRADVDRRQKECYQFLSSFIVNYSITSSLDKAFDSALVESKGELKEIAVAIKKEDTRNRLFYLEHYFESGPYRMFLSLFRLYENEGGELLNISKDLLDELTRIEENRSAMNKESRRNLIEFASTWALSTLLLCFLRFGLSNFYDMMAQSTLFLAGVAFFFAFLDGSICLYFYIFCAKPPLFKRN